MSTKRKTIVFNVVERQGVEQSDVDRIAHQVWRSLTVDAHRPCERPRRVTSTPVTDAHNYLAHRYEGETDS